MAAVSVTAVTVLDNPTLISNPLQFEIQYECLFSLEDGAFAAGQGRRGGRGGGGAGNARNNHALFD